MEIRVYIGIIIICFIALTCSASAYLTAEENITLQQTVESANVYVAQLESENSLYEQEILTLEVELSDKIETIEEFNSLSRDSNEVETIKTYTQEDLDWLSKLIYAEAGAESDLCMRLVGEVVMNRINSDLYNGDTVKEIALEKNQFSVVKNGRINVKPSDEAIRIAKETLTGERITTPDVLAFRADYYHNSRNCVDYMSVDNTYFSYVRIK